MSLFDRLQDVELTRRDLVRLVIAALGVTAVLTYLGRGVDPESPNDGRGNLIETPDGTVGIKRRVDHTEKTEFGLWINSAHYTRGTGNLYEYDDTLDRLQFNYRVPLNDGIRDISLIVNGESLGVTRDKDRKDNSIVVGSAGYFDGTKKGKYDVRFKVVYADNSTTDIGVKVRKKV